jgi:hypothetical protein
MVDANTLNAHIVSRMRELTAEESALERRLRLFRGFSHVAVLGGIIVPMLAGSALVAEGGMLTSYGPVIAVAVFITSALTALHKGLDCEAYHSECMRSIHELRSLVEGFQSTVALPADKVQATLDQLEARLQRYRERALDIPPRQSIALIQQLFPVK